ncbi:methylenetetrahydrofolate reductase [Providencia rettgeri]|uniref:methylenetetrahydrofolate reductase n=2 Tax=Providencia rettgeri TaxID=587 RepID=UPI002362ED7C|nr:methylenetetrahydrofolate reductase [Providencia rettgeri]
MARRLSFEINATENNSASLAELIHVTERLNPLYYTINTEIGQATWQDTYNRCCELKYMTDAPIIPHIAINNKDECELCFIIEKYLKNNFVEFFVIRGDRHYVDESKWLNYGTELINFIRERYPGVNIKSSIYPDYHKESITPEIDIFWLEKKCQLGVSELISQICLNKSAFSYIKRELGSKITITPSMMPLLNFKFIDYFLKSNSIDYPLWIQKKIRENNSTSHREIGIHITRFLIADYLKNENRLHFFTLNNSKIISEIFNNWNQ